MQIISQTIIDQLYNNLDNLELCYSLIDKMSPNAKSEVGFNLPAIIATTNNLVLIKYAHNKLNLNFNAPDEFGYSALHLAAKFNCISACQYILGNKLADVNQITYSGYTPLICAAFSAELMLIQLLINNGANPLTLSLSGKMAVDYALNNPHLEVIPYLQNLINQEQHHA